RFAPASQDGQRLLAHELAHTLQGYGVQRLQRQTEHCREETPLPPPAANCTPGADPSVASAVTQPVVDAVRRGDVAAVIGGLENRSIPELKAIRLAVHNENQVLLERWLMAPVQRASWQNAAA